MNAARALTLAAFALAAALSGCPGSAPIVGPALAPEDDGEVTFSLEISEAAYTTQGFKKGDLKHLVLKMAKIVNGVEKAVISGGAAVKKDIASADLAKPVTFKKLGRNTWYRVRAFAYKAVGEAVSDLISGTDSYLDVLMGSHIRPTFIGKVGLGPLGKFAIKLGLGFNAEATASLAAIPGNLVNTGTLGAMAATNPEFDTTTFAGKAGASGTADGSATAARFTTPTGMALDADGNLYVTDVDQHVLRKVSAAGQVTTIAGSGAIGFVNGAATSATFHNPEGIAVDASGSLYVADAGNHVIRLVKDGVVSTFAGAGSSGSEDGATGSARFATPRGVAVDGLGNVFVADSGNHKIRQISGGKVTTVAGDGAAGFADGATSSARFSAPRGILVGLQGAAYVPRGNRGGLRDAMYVADTGNNRIRTVTWGKVATYAGNGTFGTVDGATSSAQFAAPVALAFGPSDELFVSDLSKAVVRRIFEGQVSTIAGKSGISGTADGAGSAARFTAPWGLVADPAYRVFVADAGGHTIRMVTAQ